MANVYLPTIVIVRRTEVKRKSDKERLDIYYSARRQALLAEKERRRRTEEYNPEHPDMRGGE